MPAAAAAVEVRSVIDGDTVILEDGRHLRLIGINAFELGKDGARDQPFARAARERLSASIAQRPLRLVEGAERFDAHGRTLGTLYAADGRSLGEELVAAGLALVIALPPNVADVTCLEAAEARARAARAGLWAEPDAWTISAAAAPRDLRGFARVSGRISALRHTRRGVSITLDRRLEVWVPARDEQAMAPILHGLGEGDALTVRGWWSAYRGMPSVTARHPAMLERTP